MITVYTTGPACHKCTLTKRAFADAGVDYTEERIDKWPALAEAFRAEGHTTAPIVNDGLTGETWSDFRRDKIKESIKARAA